MFVLRESLLERSFCQSDVVLRSIACCDSGVIGRETLSGTTLHSVKA